MTTSMVLVQTSLPEHLEGPHVERHALPLYLEHLRRNVVAEGQAGKHAFQCAIQECRLVPLLLYGWEYSQLVILIMFVCQGNGHCPVFDFDWWVVKRAKTGGWYCAHCGSRYCADPMDGAVAIFLKGHPEVSFIAKIRSPFRRIWNPCNLLKWINLVRTGNMTLSNDCMKHIKLLFANIKRIIVEDNRIASQTLSSRGVTKKFCKVIPPNIDSST